MVCMWLQCMLQTQAVCECVAVVRHLANQSVMCSRRWEGVLNGLLVRVPPIPGHMWRLRGCQNSEGAHIHTSNIWERTHKHTHKWWGEGRTFGKTRRDADMCMHAYIQCMHASGWQSIFFLTPATSCNTSLSRSLSPPIRICALVIRGGLCQKVEQSWHQLPAGNRKGEVVLGGAVPGVIPECALCTPQHPNDNWREKLKFNIQILCHS